jgi:hypothetical protein
MINSEERARTATRDCMADKYMQCLLVDRMVARAGYQQGGPGAIFRSHDIQV